MDLISFGLAIVAEARTLATGIKNLVDNYRKIPETFQTLSDNVDRFSRHIKEVEKLLLNFTGAVPLNFSGVFNATFVVVRESLVNMNRTTERSFSKAFAGSSSSSTTKLGSNAHRAFRGAALRSEMNAMEAEIEKASNQLLQLALTLVNSLKMEEHQYVLPPKMEKNVDVQSAADAYCCASHAPAFADTVNLDFEAEDEEGEPATSEDPLGLASEKIFMDHAAGGASREFWQGRRPDSVTKILSLCGGLPIALSVTGSAVAFLANVRGNFQRACEDYSEELAKKRCGLGGHGTLEGTALNAGILLSLEYLEAEFLKAKLALGAERSVNELYASFCVLESQGWVPISVLCRLWQLDLGASKAVVDLFCGMSLASLKGRGAGNASSEEPGIVLHDLLLDFCQRTAEKTGTSALWHAQLLNGYLGQPGNQECNKSDIVSANLILTCAPRAWWSEAVRDDMYIHKNLARHLSCSGQGIELAALLLDARWTKLRWKIGGILGLTSDFYYLALCWKESSELRGRHTNSKMEQEWPVEQSFEIIFQAVRLSWGRMSDEWRAFQFNVCRRLASLRKFSAVLDAYLNSVESNTPKPYMAPVNSFFAGIDRAQRMEIPTGGSCWPVACSPCGRFIAAGVNNGIVVAGLDSGEVLQRMEGQTGHVYCVTFAGESKNIVSGCEDGKVVVWEWESSDSHVQVLEGHTAGVTGVVVSSDGERIFSASKDQTMRIWDATTGKQSGELSLNNPVTCIAICAKQEIIAIGFISGALKVLNCCEQEVIFEDTEAHAESVQSVSFSPNGQYLATGSDDTVCIWNATTWAKRSLKRFQSVVMDVAFSPDGEYIASIWLDGFVRLWGVEYENFVGMSPELPSDSHSISFSPDGGSIVVGSSDGFVRILHARLATMAQGDDTGGATSVSMSQNGERAAILFYDQQVQVWDLQGGELIGVHLLQGEADIALSPDGRQIVSVGYDSWARLWDARTGVQLGHPFEGHSSTVQCVSFSSDGRRFVSGHLDGSICIRDVNAHKQKGDLLRGDTQRVHYVSESLDGRYIIASTKGRRGKTSRDLSIRTIIWNRFDGTIVWKSKTDGSHSKDDLRGDCLLEFGITDDEAEKIIRNCGQEAPGLWPDCFPKYTSEVYVKENCLYSNLLGGNTLLGNLPPHRWWRYNARSNILVARLITGSVAICRLILQ